MQTPPERRPAPPLPEPRRPIPSSPFLEKRIVAEGDSVPTRPQSQGPSFDPDRDCWETPQAQDSRWISADQAQPNHWYLVRAPGHEEGWAVLRPTRHHDQALRRWVDHFVWRTHMGSLSFTPTEILP